MIKTKEDFKKFVEDFKATKSYKKPIGFGVARVDVGQLNPNKVLQTSFPVVNWDENFGSAAVFLSALETSGVKLELDGSEFVSKINEKFVSEALQLFAPYVAEALGDEHKNIQVISAIKAILDEDVQYIEDYRVVFIFEDEAPNSAECVYLKLYALSQEKAKLRSLNLNGAFGQLTNSAWSGNTPIELEWLRENEIALKLTGEFPVIDFVDKFPRFLQHIIPAENTRILDSSRVRFGAAVASGTTVMPGASYINFNAGTLGAVMCEGRISSSAIVGKGSDIGGGASILGVLSGTDGNPISIGENTLLGANSVTGIPMGNGCIVDAGTAILEGTKISIDSKNLNEINEANSSSLSGNIFKAKELSSLNGIHYRVDSLSGEVKAYRSKREVKLNSELH